MKFGSFHLIILNDVTPFQVAFIAMCQTLNKTYDIFAKRDHNGLTVAHFHRFLNKSVTIAAEKCDTNNIFVPAGVVSCYACNNAPIDGTHVLRIIPDIGHDLHFLFDINLNNFPVLTQKNAQVALRYLKLTNSCRYFSSSVLKVPIKDNNTAHVKRINKKRNLVVCSLAMVSWIGIDISKKKGSQIMLHCSRFVSYNS